MLRSSCVFSTPASGPRSVVLTIRSWPTVLVCNGDHWQSGSAAPDPEYCAPPVSYSLGDASSKVERTKSIMPERSCRTIGHERQHNLPPTPANRPEISERCSPET